MNKCLVTKLKAKVDNQDLLKLGECRWIVSDSVLTGTFRNLNVIYTFPESVEDMYIEVINSDATHHFTTENGSENLGDKLRISGTGSIPITMYVTPGSIVSFPDKYHITGFSDYDTNNKIYNIDDYKYSPISSFAINSSGATGDIKSLFEGKTKMAFKISGNATNITGDISCIAGLDEYDPTFGNAISINSSGLYGDLSVILEKFKSIGGLSASNNKRFTLNIDTLSNSVWSTYKSLVIYNTNTSGSISNLNAKFPNLATIQIGSTNITGNISSFNSYGTQLKKLHLDGTQLVGSLQDIWNCTELTELKIPVGVTYTEAQRAHFNKLTLFSGGTLVEQ